MDKTQGNHHNQWNRNRWKQASLHTGEVQHAEAMLQAFWPVVAAKCVATPVLQVAVSSDYKISTILASTYDHSFFALVPCVPH